MAEVDPGGGGEGGGDGGGGEQHDRPPKRSAMGPKGSSHVKRIRRLSEVFRLNNPFKHFGQPGGLLPCISRKHINEGTSEVKPYIDPETGVPTPFNKASQKKLNEFRECVACVRRGAWAHHEHLLPPRFGT